MDCLTLHRLHSYDAKQPYRKLVELMWTYLYSNEYDSDDDEHNSDEDDSDEYDSDDD